MRTPTDTLAALLDPITGTVRGLARFRNGARVKEYNEAPWGDAVADTGLVVRYRFAGREWDQESGLYYMRARYYDPTLGRWVSEDPIGLAGGANLFGYAGGDPVNGRDPSGLSDDFVCMESSEWTDSGFGESGEWLSIQWPDGHTTWATSINGPHSHMDCWSSGGGGDMGGGGSGGPSSSPGKAGGPAQATRGTSDRDGVGADVKKSCAASERDAAILVAMGTGGFAALGKGAFLEEGSYATLSKEGGLYQTTGWAYGLGYGYGIGGFTISTSRGAFNGPSQGVCGTFGLGFCVTGNMSGLNLSVSFGPGARLVYVDTRTDLLVATPCKN